MALDTTHLKVLKSVLFARLDTLAVTAKVQLLPIISAPLVKEMAAQALKMQLTLLKDILLNHVLLDITAHLVLIIQSHAHSVKLETQQAQINFLIALMLQVDYMQIRQAHIQP